MSQARKQGDFIQADFFESSGGLNNTDSPFKVGSNQAIAGYNYDYAFTGGIQKRYGHAILSAAPDTQKQALGYFMHTTYANVKTLLRAAGTALQTVNTSTGACTNVTDDTVSATSSLFTSTTPVVFSQFNTTTTNAAWIAGGGLGSGVVLGYYGSHVTQNGVSPPTGSIGLSGSTSGGSLPDNIKYFYAVAFHKLSTGAISNVALDTSVTTGNSGSNICRVTVDLSSVTGIDTTKYDLIYIYRSAAAGVSGFTTGDLAGTVASSATSFSDTGAVQGTAASVPRANSTTLDNSILPAGTYTVLTTWKRRLITAQNSTLYLSDLNKPESWPTTNTLTIPSGGNITALGIISFNTQTASSTDVLLVVFKERECWIVSGTSSSDWALKFVDYTGCVAQPLIVNANGFISWIDYRGVYLWDGSSKPVYCSRPIETDFSVGGDIDLSKLTMGWGQFFRKQNQILWFLSSIGLGEQLLTLKLDLRLTLPNVGDALQGRVMDGIFVKDSLSIPLYAGYASLPNSVETLYSGDNTGNTYTLATNINAETYTSITSWDAATFDVSYWDYQTGQTRAIPFTYRTKPLDMGLINSAKRFHKVIVWCKANSTANLTLNYWVNYNLDTAHVSSQTQPIAGYVTNSFWDQAYYDQGQWDLALSTYNPLVFNLNNGLQGIDGDALTLEFQQASLNSPCTIAGFSVIYSEMGLRK